MGLDDPAPERSLLIRLLIQKRPRKLERMEKREVREGLGGYWGGWISTGPDDTPTSVRDASVRKIYAPDVDLR